jgi:hypothetical protein
MPFETECKITDFQPQGRIRELRSAFPEGSLRLHPDAYEILFITPLINPDVLRCLFGSEMTHFESKPGPQVKIRPRNGRASCCAAGPPVWLLFLPDARVDVTKSCHKIRPMNHSVHNDDGKNGAADDDDQLRPALGCSIWGGHKLSEK